MCIRDRLDTIPTKDVASVSWHDNGQVYLVDDLEEAAILADEVAPEHLEVQVDPTVCLLYTSRCV